MPSIESKHKIGADVRWILRRDMPAVLEIERACFEFAWTEEEFLTCLRQSSCIGMVAEDAHQNVVGFIVYELLKSQLHVLNFAVSPSMRMKGVGQSMVERLVKKLSQQRRQEIYLEVRESNLDAQLFFRRMGFQAIDVLRGHYEDTSEDAYRMSFVIGSSDQWR